MRATLLGLIVVVGHGAVVAPIAAQQRIERFAPAAETAAARTIAQSPIPRPGLSPTDSAVERPVLLLAAGGVAGGALLGGVGALVGYTLGCGTGSLSDGTPEDDYCGVVSLPGFVLGELFGIPLGVWLANGRQGSFGADLVASLGGLIVGSGAALLSGPGAWIVIPLVPVGQIVAVILTERATAD